MSAKASLEAKPKGMLMKLNSSQKIDMKPDCFKPQAGVTASVIPAKRRSVKRMILDDIVQFFSSVFTTDKAKAPNTKNKKMISIS
ncbi:hypothetical protein D8674_027063 [Pyrus ussuriensis x Pyrus communis]|uniref:Uncharacterized protein n=1 Tax=Pyrus ussuriensis x Pyrus communis TaxID=2448454 RepID=A0A5N5IA09_9ROSA|nr:hypothetical protein D8674_027063 [Pyrus ussuriensis x Pyrus communis]